MEAGLDSKQTYRHLNIRSFKQAVPECLFYTCLEGLWCFWGVLVVLGSRKTTV